MQGSCILSASILIVIAGITANSLPTSYPYSSHYHSESTFASSFQEDAPFTQRFQTASSSKRMAIYPQPIVSDLSQKPVSSPTNFSCQRRVKLQETPTDHENLQAVKDLLPAINHFLATLSQHLSLSEVETADTWEASPYFQKYGYRYVMDDDADESVDSVETDISVETGVSSSEEETTDEGDVPQARLVSNQISGWFGPEEGKAEEEKTTSTEGDEELQESSTTSWFGFTITAEEWFGCRDEAASEEEKSNVDSDPYEKGQKVAYQGLYGSNHPDYAVEYDNYEDDIYRPRQTQELANDEGAVETTETADIAKSREQDSSDTAPSQTTTESSVEETSEESSDIPESKSSDLYDINYEPLREEADYYYEEDEFFPSISTSNGNFDIYWELTNPQPTLIILK